MLGESRLVVTPEGVARLVVGMTVQAGLGVKGTFIGDLQLIYGVVVYLVGLFRLQLCGSSQTTEGQSHEDSVEPYLVGVDGLVPEHLVGNRAGLVLQLFHHGVDGQLVLGLGIEVVHACHEMTCADVVEIILEDVVATDVALLVDHRIGIFLAVFADILTAIGQISVEHAFEFDTHDIAPLGLLREVEQEALRHAFHL